MTKVGQEEIYVQLINLPTKTNEALTLNEDGSYTIFINARASTNQQLKAYQHALEHIKNNDFGKDSVQSIEWQAHNKAMPETVKPIPSQEYLEWINCLKRKRKQTQKQLEAYDASIAYLQRLGVI